MRTFVKEMKYVISTDFTVGILGGGQLGKMLLDVTRRWDIHTRVLDANADASARNSCNQFVQGSLMDYETVVQFGNDVDVLTIEIEHVNIDALYELEKRGVLVFPKPATLDVIQNKRTQKEFYTAQKLPTAPYMAFANKAELDKATAKGTIKFPCIWKAARFGYDGFGVKKLDNIAAIDTLPEGECIVEDLVPIAQEISVIVARSASGEVSLYPPVDNEVFTIGPCTPTFTPVKSVFRLKMTLIFKCYKRPQVFITPYNNMPATSAIASIRAAFCNVFLSVKMCRTLSSVTRTNVNFYIVYKISFCHYNCSTIVVSCSAIEAIEPSPCIE